MSEEFDAVTAPDFAAAVEGPLFSKGMARFDRLIGRRGDGWKTPGRNSDNWRDIPEDWR